LGKQFPTASQSEAEIEVPNAAIEEVASTREGVKEENTVFIVQGKIALEAVEDKIIIMLDPFKTGYECKTCNGTGYEVACECGTGKNRFDVTCKLCGGDPNAYVGKTCRVCKGIGASLVIPESAQSLPTSGRIVSKGALCTKVNVGERYLFGVHVGYFLPFKGNIRLRCLREHEVLCRIYSLDKAVSMGDYFAVPDSSANMGDR
jgi:hypothetical protein